MKIEKSKSKKTVGDLPTITQELIQSLLTCSEESLADLLLSVNVWRYGKCELYHWIEVLDHFDGILAKVTQNTGTHSLYMCPSLNEPKTKKLILSVLNFTSLLIEHSYARHIYNSTEHLCSLLASPDLDIVLAVLNLFYVFGKRSNFISRLPVQQRTNLNSYLEYLGETWGGKQNGFGLAQCCLDVSLDYFPNTSTSVYFEYQPVMTEIEQTTTNVPQTVVTKSISLQSVDKMVDDISEIICQLLKSHKISLSQQMRLLTRLRLAKNFGSFQSRVKCVLIRLQAISVLVYSMAPAEVVDPLIYDGLVEELIEVLEIKNTSLQHEVKAAVLRTLTAIIHLERDPRLGVIIEATGASTYHGFLPTLVRDCVSAITTAGPDGTSIEFPLSFATSLFSFLYHLATYEASGDALVNSGIMESLLQVLDWKAIQPMNITLVTRAVRVVDLITNLDMSAFHSLSGWDKMLNRLNEEVLECKVDVPNVLPSHVASAESMDIVAPPTSSDPINVGGANGLQCIPERSALIKSILNFVKKAIPDPTFTENIRNFIDSSLTSSLAHIVSNAEYYGPSIYLPATEVTTTFIFHDPSQLSSLQDNGLPWIILNSLINKKIPVTREVLSALPSILSAICLNTRGLQVFIDAQPFDHLFGVLLSNEYLPAMRRKRGSDPSGDTAINLGSAMDELMRHQPLLKQSVMVALVKLIKKLCAMGNDIPPVTSADEATLKSEEEEGMTSDDEDDYEEPEDKPFEDEKNKKKRSSTIPLTEYTLNVVHFVDSILSNNSTDDHINEFIEHGGLNPLLSLLSLPALPLNFSTSPACNSITSTCKSILNVAHEGRLLKEGLEQLLDILKKLKPFIDSPLHAAGSILLQEVNTYSSLEHSQLLHHLSSSGSYIQLFIHLSKSGQIESRQLCVEYWSTQLGQTVLSELSKLYRALVWEGFIVLAVASAQESNKKETLEQLKADIMKPSNSEDSKLSFASTLKSFTPPLVVTSRVGRSLAELMSLLVRLCVGPLQRPPRRGPGAANTPYVPLSDDVIALSMKITDLLLESLTWEVPSPVDKHIIADTDMKKWLFSGMTFKMYAVDFCLLLLFDEHKHAYHLMLHAFSEKNVLESFIKSFYSAIECVDSIKDRSIIFNTDYAITSDFLEAWLNLAEKIINASSILESNHTLPVPPPSQTDGKKLMFNPLFNPLDFLVKAQKEIFPCIRRLWESMNSKWMMPEVVERLLTTTRHLYSSEKILEGQLKEFNGESNPSTSLVSSTHVPFVPRADPLHLQQLMDMGFGRDHAEEALLATGNDITASMEWILTHPPTDSQTRLMSEEEQLARAIALSLQSTSSSSSDKMEQESDTNTLVPLDSSLLDSFSDQLLDITLHTICQVEDTVYRSCDLITALCRRNGAAWRDVAITKIKNKTCETINELIKKIQEGSYEIKSGNLDPDAFNICLLALIMEELPLVSGSVICTSELLKACVMLLSLLQERILDMKRKEQSRLTPLWVAPLLLIFELWIGIEGLVTWRKPPNKNCHSLWMCFETINSRWCCFSNDNCKILETSYIEGEPFARIHSNRQRYVIHFNNMIQVNLDTGTRRPVLRLEIPKKKDGKPDTDDIDIPDITSFTCPSWFHKFSEEQQIDIVRSCTHLLTVDLDPDTLHANMRLLLSLTRNAFLAEIFMKEEGPQSLLTLTKKSSFQGFSSLSALLLRHILEDGSLLEKSMDNIIQSVVNGTSQDNEFKAHGPGKRDLDFVLRHLGPCATRNKTLFVESFSRVARFNNLPLKPEDYYTTSRIPPTILKSNCVVKNEPISLSQVQRNLLNVLVDHLCANAFLEDNSLDKTFSKLDEENMDRPFLTIHYGSRQNPRLRRNSYRRQVTDDDDLRSEDMILDIEQSSEIAEPQTSQSSQTRTKKDGNKELEESKQPLFSQAAILRLLAEIIESYPATSRVIIESTRKVKIDHQSRVQTKEISVIAFVLDHLLPSSTQGTTSSQVAKLAKVFLQCLATTNLPSDALNIFVGEFRAAFFRALSLPESQLKHHRIRALTSLLGQIVEPQAGNSSRSSINPSQFVRMLIRKGFITDLAKAIHSLDLSTPLLTTTVNSVLKPLECLTKIVTQFLAAQKRARNVVRTSNATTSSTVGQPTVVTAPVTTSNTTTVISNSNIVNESSQVVPESHDVSLIPLQDEEQRLSQQNETISDESYVEEAISLAHELGVRCGQLAAGQRENNDEEMDLEEIVDELLERTSDQVDDDVNDDSDDITSGEDDDELNDASNINSAGEEIGDEFESQNESYYQRTDVFVGDDDQIDDDNDRDITSDEVNSQESTDVIEGDDDDEEEEEEEEEEEDPSDNEHSGDLCTDEALVDDVPSTRDDVIDETFYIGEDFDGDDEDEEEEDDDEEGLDLDGYDDAELYSDVDFIHLEFPSWNIGGGWTVGDPEGIDNHHFNSLLTRAYHIRPPLSDNSLSTNTFSFLPRYHPILLRHVDNVRTQLNTSLHNASGSNTTEDVQRSNIVQQLLTNISTSVGIDEVLTFNVGGPNQRQTNTRSSDNFDVSLTGAPETLESTYIPNNLSRLKEESQALDGHTAHLCISALRPLIVKRLHEEYDREKKKPVVAASSKQDTTVNPTVTSESNPVEPTAVLNPSDEVTPSTVTPRNGSESVESLQTSLRAVADALAQTVAEVRNTRRLLGGANNNEDPSQLEDIPVPRSVASMPDLSSFDGSQDSARAMLSQLSPDDPLYTFLSAVARAPTPPLPESVSESLSQSSPLVTSSSAPRLPVFTQILSNNQPSVVITVPVIEQAQSLDPGTVTSTNSSTELSQSQPIQSLDNVPTHISQSLLAGSNFADVLATELARAVSNHLHPPPSTVAINTFPPITGSPSPSDTLAPMMSSLQMPPNTAASTSVVTNSEVQSSSAEQTTSNSNTTNEEQQMQTDVASSTSVTASNNELPDDIDPTFLAALPDTIRREVLSQYMREQQRSSRPPTQQSSQPINQEVLAALPPEIQEEIIQQQRLEQQVLSSDPNQPADPASFLTSLTPELRRSILSDMDDTLISQLPEEIAREAQTLRQQRESHRRQYIALHNARYEQMAATRLIPTWSGNNPHYRYAIFSPGDRLSGLLPPAYAHSLARDVDSESKQMLDQDGMSCLMVLLFLDQSKLHFNRLFRIFRSLSQHVPSRSWIIASLLSILHEAKFSLPTCQPTVIDVTLQQPQWLTININAALGSHAPVFQFSTIGKGPPLVYIHPHASIAICNNILELLIFLARQFPTSFLPSELLPKDDNNSNLPTKNVVSNFWQILFRLDSLTGRKGKSSTKVFQYSESCLDDNESNMFAVSAMGQLMSLFDHHIIQSSISLVDKLLRVLSVISGAIPKEGLSKIASKEKELSSDDTPSCFVKSVVPVNLLQSSINLLTSGKCSEDSLDDATSLLINLSRCGVDTRETILLILLEGLRSIGRTLYSQISVLLSEIINQMPLLVNRQSSNEEDTTDTVQSGLNSIVLPVADGTRSVIDHSNDLHLPCMDPLICKGSQQSFFLRLLKIVCQLRESAINSSPPSTSLVVTTTTSSTGDQTNQQLASDVTATDSNVSVDQNKTLSLPPLSVQLELEELWTITSECLDALGSTYDPHAVLALQSTVEAFFLVHAEQSEANDKRLNQRHFSLGHSTDSIPNSPAGYNEILSPVPLTPLHSDSDIDPYSHLPPDTARFLKFAERHRTVLNQVLRQTTVPLSEGPFAVLVNYTKLLDFDVKRRYFRQELEQLEEGLRREDLVIHIRRGHVFEDSYRELYRRSPEELKANLYITFDGEEGQDAGGLLREWYLIIAREMFNPNYALFKTTPGDRVTYMPNPSSHVNPEHLNYFKFVGRIIAKAIYDNKLLDCFFTRSFYKHILGKPVHYTDMESEDYAFYQGMVYLLEHDISDMGMELTFSTEIEEFGKTDIRDLKPNGREIPVTETNKREYVQLACQLKMTGSIRSQIKSFLDGFYDVIPKNLISIFNEQELELLISGLPNIDIDDLKANTEYHKYTETSLQIQWFWRALRSCSQSDRARFLQFVTGTSKVPLQGFAALEGMNGIQKFQIHRDDRSTERLPTAHTCFNQIDLPPYETYDKLQKMLLIAIRECPEGFGFA